MKQNTKDKKDNVHRSWYGLNFNLKPQNGSSVDLGTVKFPFGDIEIRLGYWACEMSNKPSFSCKIEFIDGCSTGISFNTKEQLLNYLDNLAEKSGKLSELLCQRQRNDNIMKPLLQENSDLSDKMFKLVQSKEEQDGDEE